MLEHTNTLQGSPAGGVNYPRGTASWQVGPVTAILCNIEEFPGGPNGRMYYFERVVAQCRDDIRLSGGYEWKHMEDVRKEPHATCVDPINGRTGSWGTVEDTMRAKAEHLVSAARPIRLSGIGGYGYPASNAGNATLMRGKAIYVDGTFSSMGRLSNWDDVTPTRLSKNKSSSYSVFLVEHRVTFYHLFTSASLILAT